MKNKALPACECLTDCGDDPDLVKGKTQHCRTWLKHQEHLHQLKLDNDIERLNFGHNLREHVIGKAAYAMCAAHARVDSMVDACNEVKALFPELAFRHLVLLWIGINAKTRTAAGEGMVIDYDS